MVDFAKPMRDEWKLERNHEIVQRVLAGDKYSVIARDLNITRQRVWSIARRMGIPTRAKAPMPNIPTTVEYRTVRDREILCRALKGEEYGDLAMAYGLNRSSIGRIIRRYGINKRSRRSN